MLTAAACLLLACLLARSLACFFCLFADNTTQPRSPQLWRGSFYRPSFYFRFAFFVCGRCLFADYLFACSLACLFSCWFAHLLACLLPACLFGWPYTQSEHQRWVWDAVFSADSYYIITASSDHNAKLWDVSTPGCSFTFLDSLATATGIWYTRYGIPLFGQTIF